MKHAPTVERLALSTGLGYEVLSWDADDSSSNHTLLLLHGYVDNAWGWQRVVDAGMAGRYHVLAPSLRGHGASDWVGAGAMYYFLDYVADIASLVQQRARKRLTIVGHSMGGMIASYFTGTYPERVERLMLIEGLAVRDNPTRPERLRRLTTERAATIADRGTQAEPGSRRFPTLEAAAARMRHHDELLDEPQSLELALHGTKQLPSGEWVFRHDPLLSPWTPVGFEEAIAMRFWAAITCPVLYVEGNASKLRLSPDVLARRIAAFARARATLLPEARHMMIRHRPADIVRLLDELEAAS